LKKLRLFCFNDKSCFDKVKNDVEIRIFRLHLAHLFLNTEIYEHLPDCYY
jgi:hypothetical protein